MPTISVVINARLKSTRLPGKLLLPFAGTTLIDVALAKLDTYDFFAHRYFAAAEEPLLERAEPCKNIEILRRDPDSVKPGYNDHRKVFAHFELIESDYIMWLNPCHPLLSAETLEKAVNQVMDTQHNSYTSVTETTDWIFNSDGEAITNTAASMLSTAHSPKFYRVAHGFHVIRKAFFLKDYQYWTMTKNDPALIEIPEQENYDVNTPMEFDIAEAAYLRATAAGDDG